MRRRRVIFAPEARNDLIDIYNWIKTPAGATIAFNYTGRIEKFCLGFDVFAERGHRRDDIRIGLRIAGFERRVTVAFTVDDDCVTILRLFYGGRNWEVELSD